MAKRDTLKTANLERQRTEWNLDRMPHKSTKRAKVKERQLAKKLTQAFEMED